MIVRQFLEWFISSPVSERMEAAQAFCEVFVQRLPGIDGYSETDAALTLILNDNEACVRRILAEALAGFEGTPRHIIIGLANDYSDIAIPVLSRSSVLTDADLLDCLAIGDDAAQAAIALRETLSSTLSGAIAEIGNLYTVTILVKNTGADINTNSLARIAERFGHDEDLRQLLLQREDLPITIRHALVIRLSENMLELMSTSGWADQARVQRHISDAKERATIMIAEAAGLEQTLELSEALRTQGQLTPALLLRALLCCNLSLFETALAVLTRLPLERVISLARDRAGANFSVIYRRAKIPINLEAIFKTAYLKAVIEVNAMHNIAEPSLSRQLISQVLVVAAQNEHAISTNIMGLLRRLESEAVCDDIKKLSATISDIQTPIITIEHVIDDDSSSPLACIDFNALETEIQSIVCLEDHSQKPQDNEQQESMLQETELQENDNDVYELSFAHVVTYKRAA